MMQQEEVRVFDYIQNNFYRTKSLYKEVFDLVCVQTSQQLAKREIRIRRERR